MNPIHPLEQPTNQIFPSHWNTPEQELSRWYPIKELENIFHTSIAAFILEYNDYSKIIAWYSRLQKINALPEKIPPLRQDILQILETVCWCDEIEGTPKKVGDCFSLYLIPAGKVPSGSIDTIDDIGKLCGLTRSEKYLEKDYYRFSSLRSLETVGFRHPEFILVSEKTLPNSTKKTFEEKRKMINLFARKFFNFRSLICEFPRFKYAMAANLLKIKHDGVGHWVQEGQVAGATSVQEYCRGSPYVGFDGQSEITWDYLEVSTCYGPPCYASYGYSSSAGVAPVIRGLSFEPKEERGSCFPVTCHVS